MRKKARNTDLTRFGNFLRTREERDLINQSIQIINTVTIPLFIYPENPRIKENRKTWIQIRNESRIQIENTSEPSCGRLLVMQAQVLRSGRSTRRSTASYAETKILFWMVDRSHLSCVGPFRWSTATCLSSLCAHLCMASRPDSRSGLYL